MRQPRQTCCRARRSALREQVVLQQLRQGGRADPDASAPEKTPPGHQIHRYSFITVSFRLRIRLVTLVYAASSLTSSLASGGCSPWFTYFKAASFFAVNVSRFCLNPSRRISV